MSEHDFWAGDPVVVTTVDDAVTPLSSVFDRTGTIAVARLNGAELPDEDSVFQVFMTAFDFPQYFGWNWDALSDCLRDLNWLPASAYLVLIVAAGDLVAADPERRTTLFGILRRAGAEWANPLTATGGRAVPFKVVLLTENDQVEALEQEVAAS